MTFPRLALDFNLRWRLTAALVGIAAVSIAAAGYLTVGASYQALKRQKQQDELVMARNIAAQVDEVLGEAKQTIAVLARHPDITSMDADRQRGALTLVTRVTELIDGLMVFAPDGQQWVLDTAEPDSRRLIPPHPYETLIEPVQRSGRIIVSPVFKSRSGDLVITINAPIKRDGALSGVLSGGILLRNHSMGGIEGIRIGKSGYAYLVDEEGIVIAHPQRERLLKNISSAPHVRELLKRKEGVIEFVNSDGIPILAAYAPVPETGWGVIVRQPTAESYEYAQHILYLLIAVFGSCLVAAVLLGVWFARRITRPVTALVEGARRVSAGSLDTQIPLERNDEIGELASAFNEMTRKLKAHIQALEEAHREKLRTQARLSHSEKLAALGQLVAGLAHEINNPLNVVSGFAEVLLGTTDARDPRRAYAEEISRETLRCQRLVMELLNFARPQPPERTSVAVEPLISETLRLIESTAKAQGIEIQTEIDHRIPALWIDRDQIKQAFLNLLINACQAMPDGGTLTVRASCREEGVEVAVIDSGIGIAPEHLDDLFNPFFTTKEQGTGLGLPITYSMIERHGGKIDVKSQKEKGSTFTLVLPRGEALAQPV